MPAIKPATRVWECPGAPASYMTLAAPFLPAPEGKALRVAVASQPMGDDDPPTPEQVVACVAGPAACLGGAEVEGFGTGAFYYVDAP